MAFVKWFGKLPCPAYLFQLHNCRWIFFGKFCDNAEKIAEFDLFYRIPSSLIHLEVLHAKEKAVFMAKTGDLLHVLLILPFEIHRCYDDRNLSFEAEEG